MFVTVKGRLSESQALEVGNIMLPITMKSLNNVSLVELVVRDGLLELVEGHVHLVHPLTLARVRSLPPAFVRFRISSQIWLGIPQNSHSRGSHNLPNSLFNLASTLLTT